METILKPIAAGISAAFPTTLTITRPDDLHLHLRDGAAMQAVLPASARRFARALIMPNLRPAITTTAAALAYRKRILVARPKEGIGSDFQPLMTLYLTDNTSPNEVLRAKEAGIVAFKLYPAGATTNSDQGVTNITKVYPVLEAMQRYDMVLCIHGEVTDPAVDIFNREREFLDRVLDRQLRPDFPKLKIVFEHITTAEATHYILENGNRYLAASITAHHLLHNRNAMFTGGLRPHFYCLPVPKSELHRKALVAIATSGCPWVFLGTDSAPHAAVLKEAASCNAGCYTAPTALEMYAEVFEQTGKLDKLEGFASHHGANFYGLPRNQGTITLVRRSWVVPETVPMGDAVLKPLRGGETMNWQVVNQ